MAKIWIEAYGCSASFADSEMISGMIVNDGHNLVQDPLESDLNLIVTCSVKDATANKMIHRIKTLSDKPLVIAGCLPKAESSMVQKLAPKASLLGPNSLGKTLDVVKATLNGQKAIFLQDTDVTKVGIPKIRLNKIIGIIEIATGCMSECTFCQTKLAKGGLQSFRLGDIVRQVKQDIKDGCKEIWLTSTDNGCYGFDIDTSLPELINKVSDNKGNFMIRVGMMNPMYMPRIQDKLIDAYDNSNIYKFLHIPVQSGNDKVLHDMQRGHTNSTFRETVKCFREKFPNITISTDIIVGFPTETSSDFNDTIKLIKDTTPDIVNLSRFSSRPGTFASTLPQIPVEEIKKRSSEVAKLVEKISLTNNKKWLDSIEDVLFVEKTDNGIRGRNSAYKSIYVHEDVKIGTRCPVKITKVTPHSLIGIIS